MPVRFNSTGWSYVTALPWRVVTQRFSFMIFMALALALLVLGRAQPRLVEGVRIHAVDTLAPILDAFARPMVAMESGIANAKSYFSLRSENQKLRATTVELKDWQNVVASLQKENNELRALLHYKSEPGFSYISARVIADTGGPFVRGLIVTAGKVDGVREGMAVMTGDGLVGRVVEVGDWSSRVLLITDLNSRIPVTVMETNDRAILAGDNSASPRLLFLPQDAVLTGGTHVVTSGHGGIFPPNLPIGTVVEGAHNTYSLAPDADLGHIDYVRLVDFNLKGGAFNPVAAKLEAEAKKR